MVFDYGMSISGDEKCFMMAYIMHCSSNGVAKGGGRRGAAAPTKGLIRNFLCFVLFTSMTLLLVATLSTLR